MKLYIQYDYATSEVFAMQLSDTPLNGWIETNEDEYPNTTSQEGCLTKVMYMNGEIYVEQIPIPAPTQEEISQMRQSAYEAECDQYQRAYLGYTLEGDTEKAESARKAYLRAKAEVRKRLPYAE